MRGRQRGISLPFLLMPEPMCVCVCVCVPAALPAAGALPACAGRPGPVPAARTALPCAYCAAALRDLPGGESARGDPVSPATVTEHMAVPRRRNRKGLPPPREWASLGGLAGAGGHLSWVLRVE